MTDERVPTNVFKYVEDQRDRYKIALIKAQDIIWAIMMFIRFDKGENKENIYKALWEMYGNIDDTIIGK